MIAESTRTLTWHIVPDGTRVLERGQIAATTTSCGREIVYGRTGEQDTGHAICRVCLKSERRKLRLVEAMARFGKREEATGGDGG